MASGVQHGPGRDGTSPLAQAAPQEASEVLGNAVCDRYGDPRPFGRLPHEVNEASGLAVFGGDGPVFWLHNDSGDLARLYAIDQDGALLTTALMDGVIAIDWEDMSRGPCGADDTERQCLYIGDIGDNYRMRPWVSIHRLRVPEIRPGVQRLVAGIATMRVRYPDHAHDAEALAVDETGRVFVLTKDRDGTFSLYSAPFEAGGPVVTLESHGSFDISALPGESRATVTAADYDPRVHRLLVRTYNAAIEYRLDPERPLQELVGTPFVQVPVVEERQGESIAYGEGGYWHVSEGEGPLLYFAACRP